MRISDWSSDVCSSDLLDGKGGLRAAENVVARRVRDGRRWVVVSTPRSGWTDCAGERGPGLAIWLALAEWMPHAFADHSLLFVCHSGHEYENLGARDRKSTRSEHQSLMRISYAVFRLHQ